ncbi:MAG: SDR family oxidoreductase [Potamolinea sp.]
MNSSLTRPLAVVTGASSGIGYELAKQFAQNGFDLLITATGSSINEAEAACKELGAKVETVQTDLANYDGVEKLYKQIKATGHRRFAQDEDSGNRQPNFTRYRQRRTAPSAYGTGCC